MSALERQTHWQNVYQTKGERDVSWFQEIPTISLDLIRATGVGADASIIDIGGGASRLVDALVTKGFRSITVLDVSDKALPIELPVSTIIMLRSIADIARSEGEDLSDPESALSCVQVFALGGRAGSADASQGGYFAVRGMLAKSVTEAARFIAERGVIEEGSPILVRFITQVASRFGVVVTQKVAAQALPVVGALGGAAVNYAFIEHFQEVARGHFTVRRLERVYGKNIVRTEYERLAQDH